MDTLLETLLPRAHADAVERHHTRVHAPPDAVMAALWRADLGGPIVRALLALRALPAALADAGSARRRVSALLTRPGLTLGDLQRTGFVRLGERPGREVVLGLTGRFWTPGGGLLPTNPATWSAGPPADTAQAAWSFSVAADGDGATRLETETRVRCADASARRAFGRYWLLVRPFSGLLRQRMLRSVRREAERQPLAPAPLPRDGAGAPW
jgi:hypothetical protein